MDPHKKPAAESSQSCVDPGEYGSDNSPILSDISEESENWEANEDTTITIHSVSSSKIDLDENKRQVEDDSDRLNIQEISDNQKVEKVIQEEEHQIARSSTASDEGTKEARKTRRFVRYKIEDFSSSTQEVADVHPEDETKTSNSDSIGCLSLNDHIYNLYKKINIPIAIESVTTVFVPYKDFTDLTRADVLDNKEDVKINRSVRYKIEDISNSNQEVVDVDSEDKTETTDSASASCKSSKISVPDEDVTKATQGEVLNDKRDFRDEEDNEEESDNEDSIREYSLHDEDAEKDAIDVKDCYVVLSKIEEFSSNNQEVAAVNRQDQTAISNLSKTEKDSTNNNQEIVNINPIKKETTNQIKDTKEDEENVEEESDDEDSVGEYYILDEDIDDDTDDEKDCHVFRSKVDLQDETTILNFSETKIDSTNNNQEVNPIEKETTNQTKAIKEYSDDEDVEEESDDADGFLQDYWFDEDTEEESKKEKDCLVLLAKAEELSRRNQALGHVNLQDWCDNNQESVTCHSVEKEKVEINYPIRTHSLTDFNVFRQKVIATELAEVKTSSSHSNFAPWSYSDNNNQEGKTTEALLRLSQLEDITVTVKDYNFEKVVKPSKEEETSTVVSTEFSQSHPKQREVYQYVTPTDVSIALLHSIPSLLKSIVKIKKEKNPLIDAAARGSIESIKSLISSGYFSNFVSSEFNTPLHLAIVNNQTEAAEYLVNVTNVNLADNFRMTPLQLAACEGNLKLVRLLIQRRTSCIISHFEQTSIYLAVKHNHGEIVNELIPHYQRNTHVDKDGNNLIMLALKLGHSTIALQLLDHDDINVINTKHETPLILALKKKFTFVARELINKGANVKGPPSTFWKPLHLAIDTRHLQIVKHLIDNGAEIDNDCLIKAAASGSLELVEYFVDKGIDINHCQTDEVYQRLQDALSTRFYFDVMNELLIERTTAMYLNTQYTALMVACYKGYHDVVEYLLSRVANFNGRNDIGFSPLHVAVDNKHLRVVMILSNYTFIDICDKNLDTPLLLAVKRDYVDIVECLISFGADINISDAGGFPALHVAVERRNLEIVALLATADDINILDLFGDTALCLAVRRNYLEVVQCLIACDANIYITDATGFTPLHIAVDNGFDDIIKVLLKSDCKVDIPSNNGETPLLVAVQRNFLHIVDVLILCGANLNVKNDKGYAPLLIAALHGYFNSVKLLLLNGADVNITNNIGESALFFAVADNNLPLVRLLVDNNAEVNWRNDFGVSPVKLAFDKEYLDIFYYLTANGGHYYTM